MEITEVRIKLMESTEDRLRGFCSITFDDCVVVRDLKIIEGNNGPFVAMPSRKLTSNCSKCRSKNHLRATYCNHCGHRLKPSTIPLDNGGRAKLYADIAHPVNASCREMIQNRVVEELNRELELSAQPGYSSRYDDDYSEAKRSQSAQSSESSSSDSKSESVKDERSDAAADTPPAPHNSSQDVSSGRSKPASDGFGKGIFD